MKYLHAEFARPEEAAAAVEALATAGVPKSAMEMYSLRPVETHPPALPRRSRMSLGAVLSAIVVGGGATALMYWAQLDYPLVTGGMPIISGWATGVVTFETTMAGAVFGIFAIMLWEAGLLRARATAPAPALPDSGVVVQVAWPEATDGLEAVAIEAGATGIEIVEREA